MLLAMVFSMVPAKISCGFRESKLYTATRVTVRKSSAAVHNSYNLTEA